MGAWLLGLLGTFAASPTGQKILLWLAKLAWDFATEKTKETIARKQLEKIVNVKLAEYEAIIEEARVKGLDGYTQEEIDEITKKKIDLELALVNGMPSN